MKSSQFLSQLNSQLASGLASGYTTLLKQRNDNVLGSAITNIKEGRNASRRLPSPSSTCRTIRTQKVSLGKRLALEMQRMEATYAVTPKKLAVEIITRRRPSGLTIPRREVQAQALHT